MSILSLVTPRRIAIGSAALAALAIGLTPRARCAAQTFGVELQNTMMPVSGGMGGASIARPLDVQSALGGNPAALTQYRGTNFSMGGGWAEPTINVRNDATLPIAGVTPYDDKSGRPGSTIGNIGVSQDYSALGLPVTIGSGLLTMSGLGVDFREVDASNGTSAEFAALGFAFAAGVQVTERLSVGAEMIVGAATLDGPFAGISAAVPAYALRGGFGVDYELGDHTNLGFMWHTRQAFKFDDAVRISIAGGAFATTQDINLDLPETFGWGIANDSLMDGRLLIASDILLKRYSEASFFNAIWKDQFVFQIGAQYAITPRLRFRLGYAYAENIMRDATALAVGGVIPEDGVAAVQYIQAQFPAITEQRFTGGIGVKDLLPGFDFDMFAGGMFDSSDQFGLSGVDVSGYWIGVGMTWHFQRGSCERLPIADRW